MDADEALAGGEEAKAARQNGVESSGAAEPGSSSAAAAAAAVEEDAPEETLERADEVFAKGCKAIKDGDFVEAVDCLSRALEIRVSHFGELASECVISYYKYGYALLCKAQEETDPLGDIAKNAPKKREAPAAPSADDNVSSGDAKHNDHASKSTGEEEVRDKKDAAEEDEGSEGDEEDTVDDDDEDESDLDSAWKMLDIARAIAERSPEDTMEKVDILSALGEVSMEREDIETSMSDYLKALSILEKLVEPDHRQIIELNLRLSLVLEVGSKMEEAIPYCQKAISLCSSRIRRLEETPSGGSSSENGNCLDDLELLKGISSDLEKKLEDLQQAAANPKPTLPLFGEMMPPPTARTGEKSSPLAATDGAAAPLCSSQMAVVSSGGGSGGFDSPTVSTAASDAGVTHLGVVGRGVKRAVIAPIGAEPPAKKPSSATELAAGEKTDSSGVSEVLDSVPGADGETSAV